MKLSRRSIVQNKSEWEKLGYTLPEYNILEPEIFSEHFRRRFARNF